VARRAGLRGVARVAGNHRYFLRAIPRQEIVMPKATPNENLKQELAALEKKVEQLRKDFDALSAKFEEKLRVLREFFARQGDQ
jgi:hypothetical protein